MPRLLVCVLIMLLLTVRSALAQVPANSPPTVQSYPEPATDDDPDFKAIFDGKSLDGWEGDPTYWRVEDGAIVGEVTPATLLKRNSFLIWRGGQVGDFELKIDYRITRDGNSGVNYRSEFVPHGDAPWAMRGYQADIDGQNRYTGQNYEERGRTFLALRGQVTRATPTGRRLVIGSVGDQDRLAEFIHADEWNTYHLVARGGILTHLLNGHVMSVVVDDDPERAKLRGLLGVQVHVGPPMKVEFRNILLKQFEHPAPRQTDGAQAPDN